MFYLRNLILTNLFRLAFIGMKFLAVSVGVAAINIATETDDVTKLLNCLTNSDVFLHSVTPECAQIYMDVLSEVKENKSKQGMRFLLDDNLSNLRIKDLQKAV